ncbi:MAG: hypothetical protein AB1656_03010 [Candidatus Omnitrophota bacterium]
MKTGVRKRMKVPYSEGVANHAGPESCADGREAIGEALTGESAGRVLSREILASRAPTKSLDRKATLASSIEREEARPCAVEDPVHAPNLYAQESGDLAHGLRDGVEVRARNPKE